MSSTKWTQCVVHRYMYIRVCVHYVYEMKIKEEEVFIFGRDWGTGGVERSEGWELCDIVLVYEIFK